MNSRSPYARTWAHLVDHHGPKQAARIFTTVLKATLERGETEIATLLQRALAQGEPVQLAVRPLSAPAKTIAEDALPAVLRDVQVPSASAADFDALLRGAA